MVFQSGYARRRPDGALEGQPVGPAVDPTPAALGADRRATHLALLQSMEVFGEGVANLGLMMLDSFVAKLGNDAAEVDVVDHLHAA